MRKQPDRRLVRMSIPIYQRLHEIVAQLRKDGRILFLHTIDKEIRPSVEGVGGLRGGVVCRLLHAA